MSRPSLAGGLLGQLAVARGLVTPDQLRACLELASRGAPQRPLGEILVGQGLVTPEQLQALLAEQAAMPRATPVGAGPSAPKRPPAPKRAGGRGDALDLSLSDDDPGTFEIEHGSESRVIGSAEAPSAWPPAAQGPAPGNPPSTPATPSGAAGAGARHLADLVGFALRAFASDLHLHPGHPVTIRQHGRLVPGNGPPLVAATLESAVREVLPPDRAAELDSKGETEATFLVAGGQRCRVQVFREAAGVAAIFRVVPTLPPSLGQLGLPNVLARFVTGQGLVLLTGARGSGKTWTLAALVDLLNVERQDHIVCIERPVEFVHASKRCVVTQREVPTHAATVARAVGAALHEDPDVLVIGEIEDAETARHALQAAEGGRLVLATFAAAGAVRAVSRLLGLFPADQQPMAGAMLAGALRAVVGQRLVAASDGHRRAPVCEILEVDTDAAELLSQGRASELVPGVTLDQALSAAVRDGTITRDEARAHAERTEAFS